MSDPHAINEQLSDRDAWRFGGATSTDRWQQALAANSAQTPQTSPTFAGANSGPEGARGSGFEGVSPGLVNTSTSAPHMLAPPSSKPSSGSLADITPRVREGSHHIDPVASRINRLRKGIITWARVSNDWAKCQRINGSGWWPAMLTMTYANGDSWEPKQIATFLKTLSKWLARRGIRSPYVWSAELQKRGAIHYHIVIWLPRHGKQAMKFPFEKHKAVDIFPYPDGCGWWPHGLTKVEWARKVGAMGPYLAKYISKGAEHAHKLPKGSRIFGRGGLPLNTPQRAEARWWALPSWVRKWTGDVWDGLMDIPRRLPKGEWLWRGEIQRSPWIVVFKAGALFLSPRLFARS